LIFFDYVKNQLINKGKNKRKQITIFSNYLLIVLVKKAALCCCKSNF